MNSKQNADRSCRLKCVATCKHNHKRKVNTICFKTVI